ncbi:MAG: hypothetical protein HQL52_16430 [Magnetococcales bacterium]|nr:hypothetical protein [Magnetococcales bacterium]
MREQSRALLFESIVNKVGLSGNVDQIQFRGDVSIRETAPTRSRYANFFDDHLDLLVKKFQRLLLETGVYHLGIGCHNGEIVTRRVYDPFTYEVHSIERFVENNYIERQFPGISYPKKVEVIRKVNQFLEQSDLRLNLSEEWLEVLTESNASWQPMGVSEIKNTLSHLKSLRTVEDYYLRKMTICLIQNIVEMQFNCDGTVIVRASFIDQFMAQNF